MQKIIIANFKANKNLMQVENWLNNFPKDLATTLSPNLRVFLAPPFPMLSPMEKLIKELNLPIDLAVQNLSAFDLGSYTGEVAAANLEFLDIKLAILGHSERRRLFAETSQNVVEKVKQSLGAEIQPLVCVTEEELEKQVALLTEQEKEKIWLAYEPVAAIGSGKAADIDGVRKVFKKAKELLPQAKLIYGGSVNADNVTDYLAICDGVLVGGASLEVGDFTALLKAANKTPLAN